MNREENHILNDGTNNSPRLEIQQSWWGMIGIGEGGREWTMEEKFAKIAEAGFTGILGGLPEPEEAKLWRRLLDEYKFSFGISVFPSRREDLVPLLKQASDFGVNYVNSQIMDSFVIGDAAEALIRELVDAAAEQKIPYFVETHRGRVTQDLHRTVDYVAAIPDLRLTIDFSHYAVAGEMVNDFDQADALFDRLLRRTSSIHGRISNGEQVQVSIGPDAEHPIVKAYTKIWMKGMGYWLKQAGPGDILPVLPELGPPHYAITTDGYGKSLHEISDRWQQALLIKGLFEEAWKLAN
ncbi:MAG: Xylose isomerase domain protein barrel [Bacilli bacterium]|nr:Xylose isomerase domain protein barrel [Bacilli bacterium]